jgi:hypothetical protein
VDLVLVTPFVVNLRMVMVAPSVDDSAQQPS